jgi:hypothetical protein
LKKFLAGQSAKIGKHALPGWLKANDYAFVAQRFLRVKTQLPFISETISEDEKNSN